MNWILAALLMHSTTANASPVDLQEVYLDYRHETTVGYDPMLQALGDPNISLNNHLDLHVNVNLFEYFYWNNMVNTTSDQYNFRVVGWEYAIGIRLFPFLEGGYYHHSQHWIDYPDPQHFPLENAIQLKIIFFEKNPKPSLF